MQIIWETHPAHLETHLHFKDFSACFAFATQVAMLAEQQGHHPDMHIQYNHLCLRLSTHDANNTITEKDQKLAAAISKTAKQLGNSAS